MVSFMSRLDDWVNVITGINLLGKDKRKAVLAEANILSEGEAEEIYASDDIAAKVCDLLPEDMVREGFKLNVPGWTEKKTSKFMKWLEHQYNWKTQFAKALSWANVYGGSALMLGIDDGTKKLSDPLREKNIRRFTYLHPLTRYELQWQKIQDNPELPGCGLPSQYLLMPQYEQTGKNITMLSADRLIRFEGVALPRRLFVTNGYWNNSVLSRLQNALSNYGQTHDSIASLMMDYSQAIFKVKDMAKLMTSKDGKSLLQERLDMIDYARSVINAVMIDEEESFGRETTTLTGVPEVLDRMETRLVTASGYPHTILLGEAPGGGLGDNGRSELTDYYNLVARKQETNLRPALTRLLRLAFLNKSGPTGGVEPKDWSFEFCPLWQEPEGEVIERKNKQAAIDKTYVDAKVLTPAEVARSRFGSGEYSHETKLDFDRPMSKAADVQNPTEETQDEPSEGDGTGDDGPDTPRPDDGSEGEDGGSEG